MQLMGKVAVVTGAASGLGLDVCRALARGGAKIIGLDLAAEKLAALQAELGQVCITQVANVADESSILDALEAGLARFGALHIAVNCAGVADAAKTVSNGKPFPLSLWEKVIAINLTGTFNVIRLAAVRMARNEPETDSGERGVIINTASGAATQGQIGQAAYSASKAGVIGMTLPVARDLAAAGIRVVTISPGVFATSLVGNMPQKVLQSLLDKSLLFPRRMGDPAEFGELVRHVVQNSYLNATTIDLDGGARMSAS